MRCSLGPEGLSNGVQLGPLVRGWGKVLLVQQGVRVVVGQDVVVGVVME